MDITLKIGTLDLSGKLSTYDLTKDVSYRKIVTTLNDIDHPYPAKKKSVLKFSLFPLTDEESAELYDVLSDTIVSVEYTDQFNNTDEIKRFRVDGGIESAFALRSVDGKRRYKGGPIQLREL